MKKSKWKYGRSRIPASLIRNLCIAANTKYEEKAHNHKELGESIIKDFLDKFFEKRRLIASNKSQSTIYKDEVIKFLHESKKVVKTNEDYIQLQNQMEDFTMMFDEKNIFRSIPNILKILIHPYG